MAALGHNSREHVQVRTPVNLMWSAQGTTWKSRCAVQEAGNHSEADSLDCPAKWEKPAMSGQSGGSIYFRDLIQRHRRGSAKSDKDCFK
jgi:hypothetical protein